MFQPRSLATILFTTHCIFASASRGNLRRRADLLASQSALSSPNDGVEKKRRSSSTLMSIDEMNTVTTPVTRNLRVTTPRKRGYFNKVIKIGI
mmetsp:Transcript_30388/g.36105  ORF Transcript_30388/g.36105 Transcript_30388/m.36105 type:complete len:93 (+) Transcript_30388:86-364(+)